ncbi:MAG TPA: ATP-binding protein [Xanthomonadaceae bacterium]|jgi:hypothetical protein
MARRAQTTPPEAEGDREFDLVLAVCRSAVAAGDEVLRHQVQRLLDFLSSHGTPDKAAAVRELLDGTGRSRSMAPVRLQRSRASVIGEPLTRSVRPPVDKETAVPLLEILWPEQLPTVAPALPEALRAAMDELIAEWHSASELAKIGVSPTRSALIFGLPGTGKTHLALWLAGQLELPVVVARLDGLISSFLGTTSRNIGHLFEFTERYQCVLLLDEFDAVAKLRDDPHEMGEIKRVVNTILQRLDQRMERGMTIGITNHEQLLDPAVWRRFEVQIHLPKPMFEARLAILHTYLRPMALPISHTHFLAWLCGDMSGAEIRTFVHSFKRSTVLSARQEASFVDVCRQVCSLHVERIGETRRQWLQLPDPAAVKALARQEGIELDLVQLGEVFGKAKSTVSRWINS